MDSIFYKNLLEVTQYLKAKSFKVSKSTLYNHAREGKLKQQQDGTYAQSTVDRYAKLWLRPVSGLPQSKRDEAMTRDLREAELGKLQAQGRAWEEKAVIARKQRLIQEKMESEDWLHRRELEKAHLARAVIFKSDLNSFAHSKGGEIVNIVGGNSAQIPALMQFLIESFEGFLGRYCAGEPFLVPPSPEFVRFCEESGFKYTPPEVDTTPKVFDPEGDGFEDIDEDELGEDDNLDLNERSELIENTTIQVEGV